MTPSAPVTRTSPSTRRHLTERDGRWLAVAMLADEPDIGTGTDRGEALRAALKA